MEVRDRLIDAAQRRFAAEGPIATRLQDIRADAGVSVGAVYHHFPDKEELYGAAWLAALTAYQAGFLAVLRGHGDPGEGVRAIVVHHLRWVARHRAEAALLLAARPADRDGRIAAANRAFLGEVAAWWRAHARAGAVRDLDLDTVHALWLGPAQEYARQWLGGRARRIPTAVALVLADAAWTSLEAR